MKLREFYNDCVGDLTYRGFESPEAEVRFLLKGLLDISDTDLYLYPEKTLNENEKSKLFDAVNRRISGVPIQYILGQWDFMDSSFHVGPGVLIPRPETELLCQKVIEEARKIQNPVIYDLCSGSGCIGISIKKAVPDAAVYLVEKSSDAIKYLQKNAESILGDNKPFILQGDIFKYDDFAHYSKADIIVSNPPYIATDKIRTLQKEVVHHEPIMALNGGADGLEFYRYIISVWKNKLKANGVFFFEIGDEQGSAVGKLLNENGFDSCVDVDYNNLDRIVSGRKMTNVI